MQTVNHQMTFVEIAMSIARNQRAHLLNEEQPPLEFMGIGKHGNVFHFRGEISVKLNVVHLPSMPIQPRHLEESLVWDCDVDLYGRSQENEYNSWEATDVETRQGVPEDTDVLCAAFVSYPIPMQMLMGLLHRRTFCQGYMDLKDLSLGIRSRSRFGAFRVCMPRWFTATGYRDLDDAMVADMAGLPFRGDSGVVHESDSFIRDIRFDLWKPGSYKAARLEVADLMADTWQCRVEHVDEQI